MKGKIQNLRKECRKEKTEEGKIAGSKLRNSP